MSAQIERARLLDAMLEEMAVNDNSRFAVEAALRRAGLACSPCLVEFIDTDTSLDAAYEQLTERLRRRATDACAACQGPWPRRVSRGLQALLEELAANPDVARVLTRSFPSSGADARDHYQEFVARFSPLLGEGRKFSVTGDELPIEVEMLAVGAAEAIIFEEIEAGRAAGLPALGPAILFSVLVPFLGPEAAAAEMEAAREAANRGDWEVA